MVDSKLIIFPCDHKSWTEIKAILTSAKESHGVEAWIAAFQKAHDVVHSDFSSASGDSANTGAKLKKRSIFAGLRTFLDLKTSLEESYEYLNNVFPQIVDLALEIETLRPTEGLEILCQWRADSRVISSRLAASVVSCAFLCLFPGRCACFSQQLKLSAFSFDNFFLYLDRDFQCEKLRCILRYFSTAAELHSRPVENLIFSRKVLRHDDVPKSEDWICSTQPLCPIQLHASGRRIQPSISVNTLQVVFGNRHYGGSALGAGRSKEDRWFCEQTELLSGILFIESLVDNEALVISGSKTASNLIPRSIPDSAAVSASSGDADQTSVETETSICFMDPPLSGGSGEYGRCFKNQSILGFLSKMVAGFSPERVDGNHSGPMENLAVASGSSDDAPGAMESSSALEEDITEETNETDLPLSSSSLGSSTSEPHLHLSKPPLSLECDVMARLPMRRARPAKNASSWRSNSSSDSSASCADSLTRALSLEVDSSSASATPDEAPVLMFAHRRSSVLHSGPSSRRGSTLQYQSSFASESGDLPGFSGYGRRRSSGTSEMSRRSSSSSGSSAGKRSSTDYSSEMEEYCENFQRSIIKTSVIEEESGATSLQEEEIIGTTAGMFGTMMPDNSSRSKKSLQKFSGDHPKDIIKPLPIRSGTVAPLPANPLQIPCHPTALDHFVDNLINEVAQDSKLEIEELVREQQMNALGVSAGKHRGMNNPQDGDVGSMKWPSYSTTDSSRVNSVGVDFGRISSRDQKTDKKIQNKGDMDQMEFFRPTEHSQLTENSRPVDRMQLKSLKHCRGCEKLKLEVDEFVTDFLNNVFCEAIDVYCHHFGSSRSNSIRSHVEELWIPPVSSGCHSNQSLPDQKPFRKARSLFPLTAGREQQPLGILTSQSFDEDSHHLQPRNTLHGSLFSSKTALEQTLYGSLKCVDCDLGRSTHNISHLRRVSSSREYLLRWFSSSTNRYVEKPPTSVDWFAQDLLLDAFDGALVELFGRATLQDALQMLLVSSEEHALVNCARSEKPSKELLYYAENLADTIVSVSSCEAAQHIAVTGSDGCHRNSQADVKRDMHFPRKPRSFTVNSPKELEQIASEFAYQLIEEAVQIVAGSGPLPGNELSIVTGHCPIGMFCEEPQLLALLQWIAASMTHASELHYHAHGNTQINQMDVICQVVLNRELTVGALLSEIFAWCKEKQNRPSDIESLFDFLLIRFT